MNDSAQSTRRTFFRTPVSAKTRVTLVDESYGQSIRKCVDFKTLSESLPLTDPATAQIMSVFMDMFSRIDQKLDRINEKLDQDNPESKSMDAVDTIDISGSGINLLLEDRIENERMVYLSITFTGVDRGRMDVMGRVVRSEIHDKEGAKLYNTGIEFVDLSEPEKDRLVKYTFSQQRKHIRTAGETGF